MYALNKFEVASICGKRDTSPIKKTGVLIFFISRLR